MSEVGINKQNKQKTPGFKKNDYELMELMIFYHDILYSWVLVINIQIHLSLVDCCFIYKIGYF